jgi:hypothetical protein
MSTVADVEQRLALVGSESRAAVLVEELRATPHKPSARKLLREWFNVCDALAPYRLDLREQFERVGYVTDSTDSLVLPATVYRAAWPDDATDEALSWTLDRETAEMFARLLVSPRAWFLGIKRDDCEPHIFQGLCTEAFGYITSRGESEVIAKTVLDIEPIAILTSRGNE